ncbi:hypothetical protein Tco_1251900, partial [Tanacetum coccineum]
IEGAAVTGSDSVKGVVESSEESAIVFDEVSVDWCDGAAVLGDYGDKSCAEAMDVFGEDSDEGVAVFDSDGIKGVTVSGDCGDDFYGGFTVDEGYFKVVVNS